MWPGFGLTAVWIDAVHPAALSPLNAVKIWLKMRGALMQRSASTAIFSRVVSKCYDSTMSEYQTVFILPWLHLPSSVSLGGFSMFPSDVNSLPDQLPASIVSEFRNAVRMHVDQSGRPIERFTLVFRKRHPVKWNIPRELHLKVARAIQLLALVCLSEQKFYRGHFSAHLNSAMFYSYGYRIKEGANHVSLNYERRGGSMLSGGRKFSNTIIQQPYQVEGTSCADLPSELIKAIDRARIEKSELYSRITSSMNFFLLANSEAPELNLEQCCMLSAMSWEQLLRPANANANDLSKAFQELWSSAPQVQIQDSNNIQADTKPSWKAEQAGWPIRRKWIKELYELRSRTAHTHQNPNLSENWNIDQHSVLSAFSFPLCVKMLLAKEKYYVLNYADQARIDVFDQLLDLKETEFVAKWPRIIDEEEGSIELSDIVRTAIRDSDSS